MYYKKILNNIKNNKFALIIRHAERDDITEMKNALAIPLNENGKKAAFHLGNELSKFNITNFYHSPVPRCNETAEEFLHGNLQDKEKSYKKEMILDLGGPYVKSPWERLVDYLKNSSIDEFLREWFDGKLPEDFMMPIKEAADISMNLLRNQLLSNDGNSLNVSHDWNMMILREYYFNIKHEDAGIPDFLDGFIAELDSDNINLYYHDEKVVILECEVT